MRGALLVVQGGRALRPLGVALQAHSYTSTSMTSLASRWSTTKPHNPVVVGRSREEGRLDVVPAHSLVGGLRDSGVASLQTEVLSEAVVKVGEIGRRYVLEHIDSPSF